ncbi:MAG TPA: FecR domain-containing protein [Polyangiaceae bacterium]|jgi:hypothetical protein
MNAHTPHNRHQPALDELIREAKDQKGPSVDWGKVEAGLFVRVEREARAQEALGRHAGAGKWVGIAAVLAVAAAIPLFLAHGPDASFEASRVAKAPSAGTFSWKDDHAAARVMRDREGHELAIGEAIARGDAIVVHGGRAVFTRPDPRGVIWGAEDGAEVAVRTTGETLILTLTKGAVEAQVTPVPNGEAFAIDVEGARVAVHGTHLRVEKQAGRAIVDLREGVVSIGEPPKSGATYGDLVTAPAHVEFDPADPHGTLKVSHEIYRVRAPQPLEAPRALTPVAVGSQAVAALQVPSAPPAPPPPAPPALHAPSAPATGASAPQASVAQPVPPPATPASVDPDPEKKIASAVRACARKHLEKSDGVVVTVSSRLDLRVGDKGTVEAARFDPPLAPEVQECAAGAIYGVRFSAPGAVSVPIDFTP